MRCERCGAQQLNGNGYCHVCSAPLDRSLSTLAIRPLPPAMRPPLSSARSRRLTAVTLAAVAFLLLLCLTLVFASYGLTALIHWGTV